MFFFLSTYEPRHDKTNKISVEQNECVHSKDSDQPGHPPSLISLRVRMKKAWVLSYILSYMFRLGECLSRSESSLCAHSFCWFCHVVAHILAVLSPFRFIAWLNDNEIILNEIVLLFLK